VSFRTAVLSLDPVSYWPCDEQSGTTLHDVVAGHDVTATSLTMANLALLPGDATLYPLSGNSSSAAVGDIYDQVGKPDFSVMGLVKPNFNSSTPRRLISKESNPTGATEFGYAIAFKSTDIRFLVGGVNDADLTTNVDSAVYTATINNGQLYFVVGTHEGKIPRTRLYVNDSEPAEAPFSTGITLQDIADSLTLFRQSGLSGSGLTANAGHIAIFNRALVHAEVSVMMKALYAGEVDVLPVGRYVWPDGGYR
jgi:hypothetical protein